MSHDASSCVSWLSFFRKGIFSFTKLPINLSTQIIHKNKMNFQLIDSTNKQVLAQKHTLLIPLIGKSLEGNLSSIIADLALPTTISQDFKAAEDEVLTLYKQSNSGVEKIVLLGLGEMGSAENLRKAMRLLVFKQKEKLGKNIAIDLGKLPEEVSGKADLVEACVNGSLLATYDIAKFKTKDKKEAIFPENITFFLPATLHEAAQKALQKGEILASTQKHIFDLVNLPSNHLDSLKLAEFVEKIGKEYDFSVKVLHLEEIKQLGMGGLVAINQGSEIPATFTIMEYKPKGEKSIKKVGLVGKGVTFDTGGYSIKTSEGMWQMKCDMAGAGAVIGAMEAVARLQLPIHLIAVVPSTNNMINGGAICPGDIISSYSGLTIEIEDTDAEGRVILADGLAYINKNFAPDVLIDLATLTGASIIALGNQAAALFTNNDQLAERIAQAGKQTGEKVWRLPLWDDYDKQIKSDMADVKNYGGKGGGAITAAKFLEKFTDKHPAWVHIDIAGMAFTDNPFSGARNATAYGVRLLVEYMSKLTS